MIRKLLLLCMMLGAYKNLFTSDIQGQINSFFEEQLEKIEKIAQSEIVVIYSFDDLLPQQKLSYMLHYQPAQALYEFYKDILPAGLKQRFDVLFSIPQLSGTLQDIKTTLDNLLHVKRSAGWLRGTEAVPIFPYLIAGEDEGAIFHITQAYINALIKFAQTLSPQDRAAIETIIALENQLSEAEEDEIKNQLNALTAYINAFEFIDKNGEEDASHLASLNRDLVVLSLLR